MEIEGHELLKSLDDEETWANVLLNFYCRTDMEQDSRVKYFSYLKFKSSVLLKRHAILRESRYKKSKKKIKKRPWIEISLDEGEKL